MKQSLFLIAIVFMAASCISKTKHQEALSATRDSINAIVANRDAEIEKFLADFNAIQINMDSIKQIEKMVTVKSKNTEISRTAKDGIIKDLIQLQQMLDKNKNMVSELKRLRVTDSKKLKALQETITLLEKQLVEKDGEISMLNQKIAALNIDVSNLKSAVGELTAESQRKSQELLDKENRMNLAWYIIGTEKDLIAKELLEKTGGFLGLGRTLRLSKILNKEEFTQIDIRSFDTLSVNTKKARLLSVHPEGSYHFVGADKSVESFEIDDPTAFWSVTKYMVIATE